MRSSRAGCIRLLSLALLLFTSACEQGNDVDSVAKSIEHAIHQAEAQLGHWSPTAKDASEKTSEEVSKLFTWEYRIFVIPDKNQEETQAALNSFGKEGWDCFTIDKLNSSLRAFCKRRPKTPLRYLPPFLGR